MNEEVKAHDILVQWGRMPYGPRSWDTVEASAWAWAADFVIGGKQAAKRNCNYQCATLDDMASRERRAA